MTAVDHSVRLKISTLALMIMTRAHVIGPDCFTPHHAGAFGEDSVTRTFRWRTAAEFIKDEQNQTKQCSGWYDVHMRQQSEDVM